MQFVFNESVLNATQQIPFGMERNFTSVANCKAYVSQVVAWNWVYQVIIALMLIYVFYLLYRQGAFKKKEQTEE